MDCIPVFPGIGSDNYTTYNSSIYNASYYNGNYTSEGFGDLFGGLGHDDTSGRSGGSDSSTLKSFRRFIRTVVVPIICMFGMLGNLLTQLVLTRKRIKSSCDGTERTVHMGLIALAVSDFLICLCVMPYGLLESEERFDYKNRSFTLVYLTYSGALINTFILMSTWLTVNMATSRYIAIVHPFKARHLVGMKGTIVSIIVVVLGCIIFNIPHMLEFQIESLACVDGSHIYFKARKINYSKIFMWVYFTLSICVPQTTLAFCNICLVKTLWNSAKLRKLYRVPSAHVDSNYRITSILVTIVVMYIILVSPAEILRFLCERLNKGEGSPNSPIIIAEELTNVLQTINFSFNFVLYYILNVHFRKAMKDIFCFCLAKTPVNNPKFRHMPRATSDLSKHCEPTTQTFMMDTNVGQHSNKSSFYIRKK